MKWIKFSNPLKVGLWAVLLTAPFIQRPVFVDDHAHFAEAQALSRGQNFYIAGQNSLGWKAGHAPGEANPPFYFVVMSQVIRHAGAELWKAHLAMMFFTLLGALAFYALARRYVGHPVWASVLWLATPNVWLTANSLLLDAMLAPLLLAGLAFWMEGWDRRKNAYCFLGAVFLSLAPLVKYTGLLGWVLAVLWTLFEAREKKSFQWGWLALPGLIFLSWNGVSQRLYGQSHFSAVAMAKMTLPTPAYGLTLLMFAAATTPALLLAIPALAFCKQTSFRRWGAIGFCLWFGLGVLIGGFSWIGLQIGFWLGCFFVWAVLIASQSRYAWSAFRFLMLWAALGGFVLSVAISWVCARYLVIFSAPLILLTVKSLERALPSAMRNVFFRSGAALVLIGFGFALASADYLQAVIDHRAAIEAEAWRHGHAPLEDGYYAAASLGGIGYYLSQSGWKPLSPSAEAPAHSLVLLPRRTLPPLFLPAVPRGRIVSVFEYAMKNPLRTLGHGAGYYGSIWGPLPFAFSRKPVETYVLIETT